MTLQAFCTQVLPRCGRRATHGQWGTHHLARLCALLDVHDELLLLLLELCAFAIELALCLCEGALVLAEPLGRGDRAAKEGFLEAERGVRACVQKGDGERTMMFMARGGERQGQTRTLPAARPTSVL